MNNKIFKFSVLSSVLLGVFAQAQNNEVLDEIVVGTAGVRAKPIEDLQKRSRETVTDLKSALKDQVGVQFGGGNATSQWVTIRGMGQDQIDFVVDDVATTSQIFHHQGRFSLDPALVKIVAVEKGTGSASAGLGATGGRIRAETVDARDLLQNGQNAGFRINGGYSSNRGLMGGGAVYGRFGQFDGIFVYNYIREKDYKDGSGSVSPNSGIMNRNALAKISFNLDDHQKIVLSHRHEEQDGKRNFREEFVSPNGAMVKKRSTETTNLAYEANSLANIGSIKSNIFTTTTRETNEGGLPRVNKGYGANINFTIPLGQSAHLLKYGSNYRVEKAINHSATGKGVQKISQKALYVEGIWHLQPITLTTGLRYEQFKLTAPNGKSKSGNDINPSIGIIYDVTPDLSLNASYNIATRAPRLQETLIGGANRDYLFGTNGNGELKAERSQNFELGLNYHFNDLNIEASVFNQKIKNEYVIDRPNSPARTIYRNNSGKLTNKGYEINVGYQWNGLNARAGVGYNKPERNGQIVDDADTAIPMGRQWLTSLSYQFENPKLEMGWRGRYAESKSYQTTNNAGVTTTTNRPGYGVHDIYVSWQPTGKDNFNVNFSINNVGDKYYKSHSQRTGGLYEAGRDFRLNFNYSY